MIAARHGWLAFICAALLHVLALGLFFAATPTEGAKDKGEQGVEVDLGMLGNLGDALNTTEELPTERIKEQPKDEPQKPEPERELEREPEPIKQEVVPEPPKQKVALKVKKAIDTEKKPVQVKSKKAPVDSPPSNQQAPISISQTKEKKKISSGVSDAQTTGGNPGAERSYFALLAATLAKNKRYPTASRRKGEEGIVLLSFVVDRFGGVSAAQIKSSSGYPRLDEAVLRMLKKSRRLPAFPAEMKQAELLINIPISFELNAMR
ncbi:energy transducer TonB [Neptunomonas antarctica]|uniref:Outer membrane transport energization protein TonB n=1 Tax=Neptunomonas antarctica TaxID=619304 RepID=A0A1N7IYY3_9GAMM|nr:energy transducer TonB [Neptunomonas antarctica]SIS42342.1 outer membrane transport energization protein TonB [Neptunomonas antarctica]